MKLFSRLYVLVMQWARHKYAPWYLAITAFIESIFWPIPVDVMLAPMALGKPHRAWHYAALATLFSVLGALFGALRGLLLLVLLALVFLLTPMRESQIWNTSVLAPYLVSAVSVLRPWMPQEMGRHWSSLVDQLTEAGARIAVEPR